MCTRSRQWLCTLGFQATRDILNAAVFLERGGRTNTADALEKARTEVLTSGGGDRPQVSNTVVLVTDGGSNVNSDATIAQADLLKVSSDVFSTAGCSVHSPTLLV